MVDHKDTPSYREMQRRLRAENRQMAVALVVGLMVASFVLGVLV
ncbi:MAG: hypothetical protein ACR652_18635 [Methylocystis sp.]